MHSRTRRLEDRGGLGRDAKRASRAMFLFFRAKERYGSIPSVSQMVS